MILAISGFAIKDMPIRVDSLFLIVKDMPRVMNFHSIFDGWKVVHNMMPSKAVDGSHNENNVARAHTHVASIENVSFGKAALQMSVNSPQKYA